MQEEGFPISRSVSLDPLLGSKLRILGRQRLGAKFFFPIEEEEEEEKEEQRATQTVEICVYTKCVNIESRSSVYRFIEKVYSIDSVSSRSRWIP